MSKTHLLGQDRNRQVQDVGVSPMGELLATLGDVNSGPFDGLHTYERTSVFSMDEFRAFDVEEDHEAEASGSASRSIENGKLRISTGSTSGSVYRYETAPYGIYQAGKAVEHGIALNLINSSLTGDAYLEAGLGNGRNGYGFRYEPGRTDPWSVWLDIAGVREEETFQPNWNIDHLDGDGDRYNPSGFGLDPFTQGMIVGGRFVWYSMGGNVTPIIWAQDTAAPHPVLELAAHRYRRDGLSHVENPNLPVFVEIGNGGTTQNVEAHVGGRRYDVLGRFTPSRKDRASAFRQGHTVADADGKTALLAARRKSEWPAGSGINNTVTSYISEAFAESDNDIVFTAYTVPRGATSGGTWNTGGDGVSSDHSGLEVNDAPTGIDLSNAERIAHWTPVVGGSKNQLRTEDEKGLRISVVRDRETVIVADALGTDAIVFSQIGGTEVI